MRLANILRLFRKNRPILPDSQLRIIELYSQIQPNEETMYTMQTAQAMYELVYLVYLSLKEISLNYWQEKRTHHQILNFLQKPINTTDIILPPIQGIKTLLFAKLYSAYLEILSKTENLSAEKKQQIIETRVTLENSIHESPFHHSDLPSAQALIDQALIHAKRIKKTPLAPVDLWKKNNSPEIILARLEAKSLDILIRMLQQPEKYGFIPTQNKKNEFLKDWLYIENTQDYLLLEKAGYLHKLTQSFAFRRFSLKALSEPTERNQLLSTLRQMEIEKRFMTKKEAKTLFSKQYTSTRNFSETPSMSHDNSNLSDDLRNSIDSH